ncbi:hypothetical protein PoB_006246100 [Plakobranchus ocellatus]|uniref:Uncharacterized protein n=1 Tax=Plakobranchus ocellatus TaxID=259542 RepID=A0AAV4CW77_9GAST|nr:hypothetical protein PoB_006246100 [Plakobranchus ocellatus]
MIHPNGDQVIGVLIICQRGDQFLYDPNSHKGSNRDWVMLTNEKSRPESATTKSQLMKRTQQALALREHLLYASAPISCATILQCSDVLQSTVSAIRRVTVHGPVVRRAIDLSCRTLVISTSPTAARRLVLCPLAFQVNN